MPGPMAKDFNDQGWRAGFWVPGLVFSWVVAQPPLPYTSTPKIPFNRNPAAMDTTKKITNQ